MIWFIIALSPIILPALAVIGDYVAYVVQTYAVIYGHRSYGCSFRW